jgi:hypothetical protein
MREMIKTKKKKKKKKSTKKDFFGVLRQSHWVAQAGFELGILLPQSPKYWIVSVPPLLAN